MSSASGENSTREWVLEPETEYRFELDPGSTLAIKVNSSITLRSLEMTIRDFLLACARKCRGLWRRTG